MADVGRIFFQAEAEWERKKRMQRGGTKRQQFKEGWIEFANKSVAKAVAMQLNG